MADSLIPVVTDPAMPPGVAELRSGETRLRAFLADAAADLLWHRCRTDPEFREDVLSLLESRDWITWPGGAGEAIRCESCGTMVTQVPEALAVRERRRPGIWEPAQWRRHTVRRCDALRDRAGA
jgi:hypothetical protein